MGGDVKAGFGPLVSADWLATHLADPNLRVIDFRWELGTGSRRDQYLEGHIPGAVFVALEEVTGAGGPGRHPLPAPDQFAAAMRAAGVSADSAVVVYDAAGGFSAARLWWLLGHFGQQQAAVLDGGLPAWGGVLEKGSGTSREGGFIATARDGDVVAREVLATASLSAPLVDARAGERYRGEVEPVDPRPGHIPGAVSLPWGENLDAEHRFLAPAQLRRRYAEVGVSPGSEPVVYCGSGVSACVDLLALEVAGLGPGRLYAGSWSDWSAQPALPAATGADPGRRLPQTSESKT